MLRNKSEKENLSEKLCPNSCNYWKTKSQVTEMYKSKLKALFIRKLDIKHI